MFISSPSLLDDSRQDGSVFFANFDAIFRTPEERIRNDEVMREVAEEIVSLGRCSPSKEACDGQRKRTSLTDWFVLEKTARKTSGSTCHISRYHEMHRSSCGHGPLVEKGRKRNCRLERGIDGFFYLLLLLSLLSLGSRTCTPDSREQSLSARYEKQIIFNNPSHACSGTASVRVRSDFLAPLARYHVTLVMALFF